MIKQLPRRSSSAALLALAQPGETDFVRLEVASTTSGQVTLSGRSNKAYVFRRDAAYRGHVLWMPLSVYSADRGAVARDIMAKPSQSLYKPIPFFERLADPSATILGIAGEQPEGDQGPVDEVPPSEPELEIPELNPDLLPDTLEGLTDDPEVESVAPVETPEPTPAPKTRKRATDPTVSY